MRRIVAKALQALWTRPSFQFRRWCREKTSANSGPQKIVKRLCRFFAVHHFLLDADGAGDGRHAVMDARSINLRTAATVLGRLCGRRFSRMCCCCSSVRLPLCTETKVGNNDDTDEVK
jgi:hypothetical protein